MKQLADLECKQASTVAKTQPYKHIFFFYTCIQRSSSRRLTVNYNVSNIVCMWCFRSQLQLVGINVNIASLLRFSCAGLLCDEHSSDDLRLDPSDDARGELEAKDLWVERTRIETNGRCRGEDGGIVGCTRTDTGRGWTVAGWIVRTRWRLRSCRCGCVRASVPRSRRLHGCRSCLSSLGRVCGGRRCECMRQYSRPRIQVIQEIRELGLDTLAATQIGE